MIRRDSDWQRVTWEEVISFTANRLNHILEEHGPESIGILGSARGTNEENYLAQKFARVVIGTNNVDCCARVCHTPTAAAMKLMIGTGAATNSYDDIEKTQTVLLCGANATENHPIVGARIKQAALRGANLIVIDPRKIELAQYATIHLQPRPGTNIPLLNAVAYTILEERLFDQQFATERVSEWDEFGDFIKQFPPERVETICGVKANLIRQAARLYATSKPSMCFHGLGVTEHTQGTEGVMCLVNLTLLTGNIGKPGTGINPLRGQNNVQGAAHMGCDPGILTGSVSLNDARPLFESIWGTSIPQENGLNMLEMMDAAEAGKLKALWAIGYDVALTNANTNATERALRSLDLVIVQDLFLNETARQFGSVFLPAASSFERDGTFMNAERRIQKIRKAIEPVGQSKPDWEIICALANNDAPSLHAADVGISVSTAVDVARDAADIILLERGLSVLHEGIIEGRKAFGNVMKYLLMGTSSNFGNMFSMAVASLFLPFLPMLPTQILLNNFLYDLAQVTIPTDHVDNTFIHKPQRWNVQMIRDFMIYIGPLSSIYDFLTFFALLKVFHASEQLFHTGWFVESLATQTLVIFIIRTAGNPLCSRPSLALTATTIAVVMAGIVIPFTSLGKLLGFIRLPFAFFLFLAGASVTYLLLVELVKRKLMRRLLG